jgi:putative ABC transport system permease protein
LIARLKPGISMGQARSDVASIVERISQSSHKRNIGVTSSIIPLRQQVAGDIRLPLIVLRGRRICSADSLRQHRQSAPFARGRALQEIAVRTALGAHWGRSSVNY